MHDEQSSFRYDSGRFFAALRMTKEVSQPKALLLLSSGRISANSAAYAVRRAPLVVMKTRFRLFSWSMGHHRCL